MDHFIFATYIIALIAVAVALYALYEVECIKDNMKRPNKKQFHKKPPITVARGKGHWD
jgi:hypothetical protein